MTATPRTNLITNPSFEVDTTGATGVQASLARNNTWFLVGAYSCRITPTGTNDSYMSFGGQTNLLGVTPGQTITASGTIYLAGALAGTLNSASRRITIWYYSGSWTLLASSAQAANSAGATRLSVTGTVPVGATGLMVRFYDGASSGNGNVWWDALLLEIASTMGTYFDGTWPEDADYLYTWTSTAHASTSYAGPLPTVDLTTVWMNVAADPQDFAYFPAMAALGVKTTDPGEVRRYAGGRLRAVRRLGQQRTVDVELPFCEQTQVAWVQAHVGQLVCVRDDRGRKVFGIYSEPQVDELRYSADYSDVTLSVTEVTHSEEV